MARQDEHQRVMETLPEVDAITPEAIAKAKEMIGARLRTENFVRDASLGALLNFVNGIGDSNPIFRDQEYAAYSTSTSNYRWELRTGCSTPIFRKGASTPILTTRPWERSRSII